MSFVRRMLGLGQPKIPLLNRQMLNLHKETDPVQKVKKKLRFRKSQKQRFKGGRFARKVYRFKLRKARAYKPGSLGLSVVSERIKKDYHGAILSRRERREYAKRYSNIGQAFSRYYGGGRNVTFKRRGRR